MTLTIADPEAADENGRPIRIVRRMETNPGDLCADADRNQSGADIVFENGGIRTDIAAGGPSPLAIFSGSIPSATPCA